MPVIPKEEIYIDIRCKVCDRLLCKVSDETTGTIKQKCKRCSRLATISLPLKRKANTITDNAPSRAAQ